MLKKLFVYEWKETWLLMTILNVTVLVISIIGFLMLDPFNITHSNVIEDSLNMFAYSIYIFAYIIGVATLFIATNLVFYIRFYKNLYTDQGYLMHTLPVTKNELILSKFFVAVIWKVISTIVIFVGIEMITFKSFSDFISRDEFIQAYEEAISRVDKSAFFISLILLLLYFIGSMISSILMGYASVSLGQLASKNKLLASIGAYICLTIIRNIVRSTINIILQINKIESSSFMFMSSTNIYNPLGLLVQVVFVVLCGVVFYYITHYMMNKRLNLE